MKRHIPATIALKHRNPASRQLFGSREHMSGLGIASKCNDRRMFQQQQDVANVSSLAQIDQLLLQSKAFAIFNLTELTKRNHARVEIIGLAVVADKLPGDLAG